ncbi:MAG: STAS domain-containing protein [Terriglobia bacterium]
MTLSEEKNGRVCVLGLSGKLDIEGAKMLVEKMTQILDGGERYIVLDFTDISYINSAGLRGLILVAKQLASFGGKLVLAGVSEPNQNILEISGLTSIFTLRPTRAEALGFFPQ